jgi:hypothetical protein
LNALQLIDAHKYAIEDTHSALDVRVNYLTNTNKKAASVIETA